MDQEPENSGVWLKQRDRQTHLAVNFYRGEKKDSLDREIFAAETAVLPLKKSTVATGAQNAQVDTEVFPGMREENLFPPLHLLFLS